MNFYHEGFFKLRLNESIVALHHSNVAATAMMQLTTVSTAVQHHRHWATMAGIFRTIITNSVETKFFWTFPAHSYYLIYYFYYIKNIFLCNKIIIRQRKKICCKYMLQNSNNERTLNLAPTHPLWSRLRMYTKIASLYFANKRQKPRSKPR